MRKVLGTMKGAYYNKRDGRWFSRMTRQGKLYHLGTFSTEIEAHLAYTRAMADELGYIRVPLKVMRSNGVGVSALGKIMPGLGVPPMYSILANDTAETGAEWYAVIDPEDADLIFGVVSTKKGVRPTVSDWNGRPTEWYVKRLHNTSPLVFAVNDRGQEMGDFIMEAKYKAEGGTFKQWVRHVNYNGLDCRRRNLEEVDANDKWKHGWHMDGVIKAMLEREEMRVRTAGGRQGRGAAKWERTPGVTELKSGKFVARAPLLAHLIAKRAPEAGSGAGATPATRSGSPRLQKYLGIHATIEGAVAAVKQYEDLTAMALAWMDAGSPEVITEDVWESLWAAANVDKELRAVAASLDDDSGLPALVVFVRRELGGGAAGGLSIGEAAARLGVKPHVLRQMERTGALVPAGRSRGYWPGSGHRRYTEEQVEEMRRRMG